MKKYLLVIRSTWDEIATYRFNFTMWRIRNVFQLLTIYFLWLTVSSPKTLVFGYSQTDILTYVLGAALLSSIVLSTRTQEIGENINVGDLSNFLVKPFAYFGYWFARDIGDKAFNIVFAIGELTVLYFLLKPPIFLQTDIQFLLLTVLAVMIAIFLNFFIGCLLSMVGFWSPDVWAPRFIFFVLIGFLAGGAFPLDIFPASVQTIFQFSPFSYFLYFPLKIYLGTLSQQQLILGFTISLVWVVILYLLTQYVWKKGLKQYSAQGS
jgi:ABC-2 type transport system permease protein